MVVNSNIPTLFMRIAYNTWQWNDVYITRIKGLDGILIYDVHTQWIDEHGVNLIFHSTKLEKIIDFLKNRMKQKVKFPNWL